MLLSMAEVLLCIRCGEWQHFSASVSRRQGCSCAAAGAELDATKVLDALSEDMPLSVAVDIIARMLRTAIHARRSAAIVRNLHRSLHLSTAAERAEVRPSSRNRQSTTSRFSEVLWRLWWRLACMPWSTFPAIYHRLCHSIL